MIGLVEKVIKFSQTRGVATNAAAGLTSIVIKDRRAHVSTHINRNTTVGSTRSETALSTCQRAPFTIYVGKTIKFRIVWPFVKTADGLTEC